ncbi:MAG: flagellar assembly protein FliW [Bacillota bacterium]
MRIKTKFFGEIEANEESIFVFESGIPGFADLHKYVIMSEEGSLFNYMQSIDNEDVCFVMVNPFYIMEDYDIELCESTVSKLEIEKPEDIAIYSILTIYDGAKKITANLKAPLVINTINKKGIQEVVDDDRYSTRHILVKETDK